MANNELPSEILHLLSQKNGALLSSEAFPSLPYTTVKSALDSLKSRLMVDYEAIDREELLLEAEGEEILANGSHEVRVFEELRKVRV